MPLQSSLSPLRRSPKPFLLLRTCLVLVQPRPAHLRESFIIVLYPKKLLIVGKKTESLFLFCLWPNRESVRACALCNCVERSLHGQRELRHFGPSSEWQTPLKPSASPLPQPGNDDLSSIGFSDAPCLASLFDDSGKIQNIMLLYFNCVQ